MSQLVVRAFEESIATLYSPEGVTEFLRFATSEAIKERGEDNCQVFVADTGHEICGMVEVRDYHHISMLFVEPEAQRLGIGRRLLNLAIEVCLKESPQLREVTVNSSPNAVEAYRRFGFAVTSPEKEKKGLRFTPMRMTVVGKVVVPVAIGESDKRCEWRLWTPSTPPREVGWGMKGRGPRLSPPGSG